MTGPGAGADLLLGAESMGSQRTKSKFRRTVAN